MRAAAWLRGIVAVLVGLVVAVMTRTTAVLLTPPMSWKVLLPALKARIEGFEAERTELRALRQERKEIVSQMDAILRELDKLDI